MRLPRDLVSNGMISMVRRVRDCASAGRFRNRAIRWGISKVDGLAIVREKEFQHRGTAQRISILRAVFLCLGKARGIASLWARALSREVRLRSCMRVRSQLQAEKLGIEREHRTENELQAEKLGIERVRCAENKL
ncbi:hypothetical protein D3P09_19190 [Paenibacillus pinisoli]|uniref:Uncharacterized protein n=1 Tax=Paenibacillus pinisoli TaxID=1276110 RepID=A0A3A6PQR1_9BACL|nr:hypothetical protein D3P09_19190 [Paenibacillus pinisoli]